MYAIKQLTSNLKVSAHLQCLPHNEFEKSGGRKDTIQNPDFFDIDSIINKNINNHKKN